MFGNPGGIVAAELAQDRFEEDVKLMSRSVSRRFSPMFFQPWLV
jgi:hypothetical protein